MTAIVTGSPAKIVRLLRRLRAGVAPRCSRKEFETIRTLLPGMVNLESAHGADLSAGYVLVPLHTAGATNAGIDALNLPPEGSK